MEKYVTALDQRTISSRCILSDREGDICSVAQREFTRVYPQPGWVEHDPMGIWSSQLGMVVETIGGIGTHIDEVAVINIIDQRETTTIWDKQTGVPIYNATVWQRRRTSDTIGKLKAGGMEQLVKERAGLILDAYSSGSKIAWILDHVEGAREWAKRGELLSGTVDTWLTWNLTRGAVHATNYTNVSRTMLRDIRKLCWDREILDYFGIPACMLPEVKPSSCLFSYTFEEVIGRRVPITDMAGDQQTALFGQYCFEAGEVENTYGTGCFLLVNTGEKAMVSENDLLTTIAVSCGGQVEYALEGSVFIAGASIQWLRDELRMIKAAAQSKEYCNSADDTAGVYIAPASAGLRASCWHQHARGTIVGLIRGTSKEHFIRVTVESLAYQVYDLLEAMQKNSRTKLHVLKADGGAFANNFLVQLQPNILDTAVVRPQYIKTTTLSVAYLAGLAVGYWKDKGDIRKNWKIDQRSHSEVTTERGAELMKGWKRAVRCALFWAEGEDENEV